MIKNLTNILRDFKNYFFPNQNPFGKKISATKDYYLSMYEKAKNEKFQEIDNLENSTGFNVDKAWLDELALHTQVVKKKSAINYQHGRVLYSLLRKYIQDQNINFIKILEIGTARGFSSICMSRAIIDSKINGNISTIDIILNKNKIYWNCIDDHDGKKSRQDLLCPWEKELKNINFLTGPSSFILKKINYDRINFAFIDGMHDYLNVRREFKFISTKQLKGDLIIFDDYSNNFPDIVRFVEQIREDKVYEIKIISSTKDRSYAILQKKYENSN